MSDTGTEAVRTLRPVSTPPMDRPLPPTDVELSRFVTAERQRQAAADRRLRHWAIEVARESGTLLGVLIDLAERGDDLAVRTAGGHTRHGPLVSVGGDHVELHAAGCARHLIPIGAVTSVRAAPGLAVTVGDRVASSEATLADALRALAAERAEIAVVCRDGDSIAGRIVSVGGDVVRIRTDANVVYLALTGIAEVTVW